MDKDSYTRLLQGQFPGRVVLYVEDLVKILGKTKRALDGLIARKQLPFKIRKFGGRWCVDILQVAAWLAADAIFEPTPVEAGAPKPVKPPGRPRKPTESVGFGQISLSKKLAEMRNAHGYVFFNPVPDASNEGAAEFLIELNDALLSESFKELVELHVEVTCYGDVSKRLAIRLLRYESLSVNSARNVILHVQGDWSIYAAVVVRAYKDGECVYELSRTGEQGAWVVGLDTLD
jgi:hypothetical protein